jgi:hypothetical protein
MLSQQLSGQSQKKHSAGTISRAYALIIILDRKKSITTATRPVEKLLFLSQKIIKSVREIKNNIKDQ